MPASGLAGQAAGPVFNSPELFPFRVQELDDLADPIADLEADGKGIPILIKQYARLGGRLLSFNVDRSFSDVLDGFVLIDLRQTDPSALARYMGKPESEAFRRYHGMTASAGEA